MSAKLAAIPEDERLAVQAFLDWLYDETGYRICERNGDGWDNVWMPVRENREQLMARHFQIDLDAVSREKDQALREFVSRQEAREAGEIR